MSRLRPVLLAAVATALLPLSEAPALAADSAGEIAVGPGAVSKVVPRGAQRLHLRISPNRASSSNTISIELTRAGTHLRGARVTMSLEMAEMAMAPQTVALREVRPGVYAFSGRALVMGGTWGLVFRVAPRSGMRSTLAVVDSLDP
jgi:YtkA-like